MPEVNDFACSTDLRQALSKNLDAFPDTRLNESGSDSSLRHAAVAITIFQHDDEGAVIVTKRSPRLDAHSGQWAIPGGRIDAGENAIQASLRELREEVNLHLEEQHVLGLLDDYQTRSGYVITPVVVWSDSKHEELKPNPDEVASIHAFSFSQLIRTDSPNLETIPESDRQVLSMNYLHDRIYSPTAAMLYQFREVALLGKATRVAHYDQPVFAWK